MSNNHKVVCTVWQSGLKVFFFQIIIKHMQVVIKRNEGREETGKVVSCGQAQHVEGVESGAHMCPRVLWVSVSAHIWALEAVYKCKLGTVMLAQAVGYSMEVLWQ